MIFVGEDNHNKLSIVERFNRTIRELISKYMHLNGTIKWIDTHKDLIEITILHFILQFK